MRKLISMLLILSMLLCLQAASAEDGETTVIDFPELPFTTLADFDCVAQVEGDRELFVYTGQLEALPYLYVRLEDGEDRITDGDRYISDVVIAGIRDNYGANGGLQLIQHGNFRLGDRPMANADMEFKTSSGMKVYELTAIDVQEAYSVVYSAVYADPNMRDSMLTALNTLAANLRYTGGAATSTADAGAVPVICNQQGYITLADPAWRTEWVDGDGMYFHFGEDNMPYVLAWVQTWEGRITDGMAFLEESAPEMQERYRQNGAVSTALHGSFSVGGRPVAALDVQYRNSSGLKIYLLVVVDVREDFTAIYRTRYLSEDGRQQALDALDLIASNLRLTAQAQAQQSPRTDIPQSQEPSAATVYSLSITDIRETENGFGRCAAPEDYDVQWRHSCCTAANSISIPHRLGIIAECAERGIIMRYISGGDYLSTADGSTEYDGQFDTAFFTPRLHCMNASEYCDYLAVTNFPQIADSLKPVSEDALPEAQQALNRLIQAKAAQLQSSASDTFGICRIKAGEYSICKKRYSFDYEGTPHDLVVLTACLPIHISTSYYGLKPVNGRIEYAPIETNTISWEVPFTYMLTCPSEHWEEGSAAFDQFVANTRTSDQFDAANRKLAVELWKVVEETRGLNSGAYYSERALREETQSGDDYYDERITDYIFDQNDYSLSDGSHVKVSAAYDYVYEGDNGNVYYSSSAFAQPGGSAQLYPNG